MHRADKKETERATAVSDVDGAGKEVNMGSDTSQFGSRCHGPQFAKACSVGMTRPLSLCSSMPMELLGEQKLVRLGSHMMHDHPLVSRALAYLVREIPTFRGSDPCHL